MNEPYLTLETMITVENCTEIMNAKKICNHSQGQAWSTVHDLCIQLGMPGYPDDQGLNGIEKVVKFITGLKEAGDRLKELEAETARLETIIHRKDDEYNELLDRKIGVLPNKTEVNYAEMPPVHTAKTTKTE